MGNPVGDERGELLKGRWVWLRPITSEDVEMLYRYEMSMPSLARYRHRGVTMSPADYVSSLFGGTLCSFVLCQRGSAVPIGSFAAFASDFRGQNCRIAASLFEHRQVGWSFEGFALAVEYLFEVFPLRKIYMDVLEFNLHQFGSIQRQLFRKEGHYEEHEFYRGRWWAIETYSLFRSDWEVERHRFLPREALC